MQLGYTALDWPAYGWVAAALILVTLMTIQGLGFLTPVNVFVCLQLQKPEPDMRKISTWMRWYFYAARPAGIDASGDHRRHDAISRRHLSRRFPPSGP